MCEKAQCLTTSSSSPMTNDIQMILSRATLLAGSFDEFDLFVPKQKSNCHCSDGKQCELWRVQMNGYGYAPDRPRLFNFKWIQSPKTARGKRKTESSQFQQNGKYDISINTIAIFVHDTLCTCIISPLLFVFSFSIYPFSHFQRTSTGIYQLNDVWFMAIVEYWDLIGG